MMRVPPPLLPIAMLLVAGSCSPPRESKGTGESLLLVTLDTFRADAAGCGGNPSAHTPHLDRLARGGTQFRTGLATSPLTLPSHASILTGLNPPATGVRDNGIFRLPESIPTLATALHERDWKTGAFLGGFPLDARFGLARGFDVYDDDVQKSDRPGGLAMGQRPGIAVVQAFAAWLAGVPAGAPWFGWVHLFDAHTPYEPPLPLYEIVGRDPYLGDVALADHFLGQAIRLCEATRDGFHVVVLGDHGESRGEHGEANHGVFVYDATIRIPAVVRPARGGAPGVHPGTFRGIDFPATAFALLGLDPATAPGVGVVAGASGRVPAYMESLYALYHHGWSGLRAVRVGDWKYVEAPEPELYDLGRDPGEARNLAGDDPERAAELAVRLEAIAAREIEARGVAMDARSRETLESLGYATGRAGTTPTGLADPKRMIEIQHRLEAAEARISAGRSEEAIGFLEDAIARDPGNKEAYRLLGLVHSLAGRGRAAVVAYEEALRLPPHDNDRVVRAALAGVYLRVGAPARAAEQLEIALAADPQDEALWFNLGVARKLLGDERGAAEAWERTLALDPGHELAREELGR